MITVPAAMDGTLIVEYGDGYLTRLVRYLLGGLPRQQVASVVRLNQRCQRVGGVVESLLQREPRPTGPAETVTNRLSLAVPTEILL